MNLPGYSKGMHFNIKERYLSI